MPPLIGKVTKAIGAGIGLAAETYQERKEKGARERSVSPNPQSQGPAAGNYTHSNTQHNWAGADGELSDSDSDLDPDHTEWALDEAAEALGAPPGYYSSGTQSIPATADDAAALFLNTHDLSLNRTYRPLPMPVILPQRRPKDKSRGFVRAYAPLLGECSGIDQATFIDFIDSLDAASKASGIFNVINLACFAVGVIPTPVPMAVSMSVMIASHAASEMQTRHRRNAYLDKINEELFKPRGLYCLIMTFRPESSNQPVLDLDLNDAGSGNSLTSTDQALLKASSDPESSWSKNLKNMRLSSGKTEGEFALPESAPLIFPAIDKAASDALDPSTPNPQLADSKKNALKEYGDFVSSYLDRRSQASYTGSNPQSKLAAPPQEKAFASRYSDPNHAANSGTILGLLTGGHFDPHAKRRGRRAQRRAGRHGQTLNEHEIHEAEMGRAPRKRKGLIKRVLKRDLLYLTVVNLPTESEMREMAQEMERIKALSQGR